MNVLKQKWAWIGYLIIPQHEVGECEYSFRYGFVVSSLDSYILKCQCWPATLALKVKQ